MRYAPKHAKPATADPSDSAGSRRRLLVIGSISEPRKGRHSAAAVTATAARGPRSAKAA